MTNMVAPFIPSHEARTLILQSKVSHLDHDGAWCRVRRGLGRHLGPVRVEETDAALINEALEALLVRHRSAEVDASYAAYDQHPIDEPAEWGDLASFRRAPAAS